MDYVQNFKNYLVERFDSIEDIIEKIEEADWGGGCPRFSGLGELICDEQTLDDRPYAIDENGCLEKIWTGNCFNRQAMSRELLGEYYEKVEKLFKNNGGCRICWSINYYAMIKYLAENEGFWKVDSKEDSR